MKNSSSNSVQELNTPKSSVRFLIKESYIEAIKKSVGVKLFQNLYAEVDGQKTDILQNGRRSCAVFVSRILFMFKLIHDVHASVYELVQDLESSGWEKVETPEIGDVLLWEPRKWTQDSEVHDHLGFYVGNSEAVSNHYESGEILRHHFTYGEKDGEPVRKITAIYRYDFDSNYEKILLRRLV